jgi:CPA1 family monovalent cation:H+ antiporter
VLGLITGAVAFFLMRTVDEYVLEIIITLALVTGTYSLAHIVHTSGPVAVVIAGLLIGNPGVKQAMSETTREQLHGFWKLIDEILNALLFLLIGLEVVAVSFDPLHLALGLLVIPVVLLARFVSVGVPLTLLGLGRAFTPGAVPTLTWGGLKGGISVALALSLPAWPERELILTITYAVVVFSIVVQGLTVGAVVKRFVRPAEGELDLD